MGITYKPLKRKHTNPNFLSTSFDILKEMDLKYALAFLLVGFILSVNGQDANGFEGRPEENEEDAKAPGNVIICGTPEHEACFPGCQCQLEDNGGKLSAAEIKEFECKNGCLKEGCDWDCQMACQDACETK